MPVARAWLDAVADEPDGVVVELLLVAPDPIEAFVRMNALLLELRVAAVAPGAAVPLVPVAPSGPRCKQPVHVMVRVDELCVARELCDDVVDGV